MHMQFSKHPTSCTWCTINQFDSLLMPSYVRGNVGGWFWHPGGSRNGNTPAMNSSFDSILSIVARAHRIWRKALLARTHKVTYAPLTIGNKDMPLTVTASCIWCEHSIRCSLASISLHVIQVSSNAKSCQGSWFMKCWQHSSNRFIMRGMFPSYMMLLLFTLQISYALADFHILNCNSSLIANGNSSLAGANGPGAVFAVRQAGCLSLSSQILICLLSQQPISCTAIINSVVIGAVDGRAGEVAPFSLQGLCDSAPRFNLYPTNGEQDLSMYVSQGDGTLVSRLEWITKCTDALCSDRNLFSNQPSTGIWL